MEDAQACAGEYLAFLSDNVQMAVRVCKHMLQRFASEDYVAGEFLHQDGKVGEVGRCVCEEFLHC